MLLLLTLLFVAAATFAVAEAATYPARLKERSIKRATEYGRVRIPEKADELLRFRERVLMPAAARLSAIPLKLNPRTNLESIGTRLSAAGLSQKLTTASYLAIKGAGLIAGALLGLLMGALGSFVIALILVPVLAAAGFRLPDYILSIRIRSRREAVRADLPDALDLLAVSVEAGLGFDAAVSKLSERMEGPLVDEFGLVLHEMRIGESRSAALKSLSDRVDVPEVAQLCRAIIQADQLGIALSRILRVQSHDMRIRRQLSAEEKAMKAPVKMLFPTVVFIFPSMFVVALGPAAISLLQTFGGGK